MNILAFDTCFGACSAAVARGAGTADVQVFARFEPMATGHAERLIPMIGEVLAEARLSVRDIGRIGVTIGPGTFAGTRICVAAARALALAHATPLSGVTSLAVMAREAAIRLAFPEGDICVAVDVRRDEVYVQSFDSTGLVERSSPALVPVSQAALIGNGDHAVYVGSAGNTVWQTSGMRHGQRAELADLLPDALYITDILSQNHQHTCAISPLYLRPPDAKPPELNIIQRR
jgi:tRNA threonylcarbamoyladenosine biosynthesis protein TsaB